MNRLSEKQLISLEKKSFYCSSSQNIKLNTNKAIATNEKVYALLCVGFVRLENSVYTVLCWCVGLCVRQFYFINF